MGVSARFECDTPGCGSYVETDVLHREGTEFLWDVSARRDDGDAIVGIEAAFRLEGWFVGAAGHRLRVLCPACGAVCPACAGAGFLGRAPYGASPCRACDVFGVVVAADASGAEGGRAGTTG